MAANIQFFNKENESVNLNHIDEEICLLLGVEVHPKRYGGNPMDEKSFNWFDSIAFQLTQNKTLEEGDESIRNHFHSKPEWWGEYFETIDKIINHLQENYTVKSWHSWGK